MTDRNVVRYSIARDGKTVRLQDYAAERGIIP